MLPGDIYYYAPNSFVLCVQQAGDKKIAPKTPNLNPNANVFQSICPTTMPPNYTATGAPCWAEAQTINNLTGDDPVSIAAPVLCAQTLTTTGESSPAATTVVDYNLTGVDVQLDDFTPTATSATSVIFSSISDPTSPSVVTGENGPLDSYLPSDQLRGMLRTQLEYYFSRENLANDTYLVSQMDADQFVPVAVVANFNQVKRLTRDLNLVIETLRELSNVQVDDAGEKVRPMHKRCIVILREIPDSTPLEDVEHLFSGENCPKFLSCQFAHNNSWYVMFDTEEDAQRAYRYLREEVRTFNGVPIMARIKAKPLQRSSFVGKESIKAEYVTNVIYPQTKFTYTSQVPSIQYIAPQSLPYFSTTVSPVWSTSIAYFDPGMAFAANGYIPTDTFTPFTMPQQLLSAPSSRQQHHQQQLIHQQSHLASSSSPSSAAIPGVTSPRRRNTQMNNTRADATGTPGRHGGFDQGDIIGSPRENPYRRSWHAGSRSSDDQGSYRCAHGNGGSYDSRCWWHNNRSQASGYTGGGGGGQNEMYRGTGGNKSQRVGGDGRGSGGGPKTSRHGGSGGGAQRSSFSSDNNDSFHHNHTMGSGSRGGGGGAHHNVGSQLDGIVVPKESQPARSGGGYRGRGKGRPGNSDMAKGNAKPKDVTTSFELEDNSFPPLPGTGKSVTSGDLFETKIADVVRGTTAVKVQAFHASASTKLSKDTHLNDSGLATPSCSASLASNSSSSGDKLSSRINAASTSESSSSATTSDIVPSISPPPTTRTSKYRNGRAEKEDTLLASSISPTNNPCPASSRINSNSCYVHVGTGCRNNMRVCSSCVDGSASSNSDAPNSCCAPANRRGNTLNCCPSSGRVSSNASSSCATTSSPFSTDDEDGNAAALRVSYAQMALRCKERLVNNKNGRHDDTALTDGTHYMLQEDRVSPPAGSKKNCYSQGDDSKSRGYLSERMGGRRGAGRDETGERRKENRWETMENEQKTRLMENRRIGVDMEQVRK